MGYTAMIQKSSPKARFDNIFNFLLVAQNVVMMLLFWFQWPEFSQWMYPVYRVTVALYFFVWFVISIVEGGGIIPGAGEDIGDIENPDVSTTTLATTINTENDTSPITGIEYHPKWFWLVFLTNWTFTMFNIYLIYSAFSVTYYYFAASKL